ncbi:SHC-transforming protein 2 isoform X2 [Ochotona curzoniae]|uniref:SHC-transforming protein 2 isoform X2 n=1 Tax=Ochotona curzoniae TaxID=130825 RepID=UPI001B3530D1|nr:SHC-transforming protein 2 isoform X2 [Ochotona curzoniae]
MTQGPGGRASPAPPEPEAPTTFCALLPRMPQWKFAAPAGFLGRGPAATRATGDAGAAHAQSDPAGPEGVPALAAAVLGACEPRCAAPCPLPALSRCRAAGARGPRGARGARDAAGPTDAEWIRKGSFIHKPAHGWLHPDSRVLGPGVCYVVRYMGCIQVLRSMRSLDFHTRTQVTREAINRLHEAVPGVRGSWKKKAPNKALASILGTSNLRFAGMTISVHISVEGLSLSVPATRQTIASHHMQSISFASGGDTDMTDYVAYVAKDPINQRACHILECCEGLAQRVISTVGQAFELRFKQYLHSPPQVGAPPERLTGLDESAWGDEEETPEHNYYNSIPGKEPPLGGLLDSRLALTQPCALGALGNLGQGGSPARRETHGLPWDLEACGAGPFEEALKTHPCALADRWPSPPTRRAPVAPTEEQLRQEPWYHGRMTRRAAERLLRADGDFLVRDSATNPGQYVLTGMQAGQPKHLLLVDPEGVVRTKDVLFDSISHLIDYHLQNGQPIVAAESELHLRGVVTREP